MSTTAAASRGPQVSAVTSLMRVPSTTTELHDSLAGAAAKMDRGALLIVDSDNKPIAILTLHDLRRAVAAEVDVRRATVEKWATPSPRTIQTNATIIEAARALIDAGHGHIPVVDEHHRVVGIVSRAEVLRVLAHSPRIVSAVIFVSNLDRSAAFYRDLLNLMPTHSDATAAFLAASNGTLLCLRALREGALRHPGGLGLQYVIWTAADEHDLARCEGVLRSRNAHIRTSTFDRITAIEGRDPDAVPVLITYPAPGDAQPGALAPRIYTW
ncbi:MAG: CBS domain-containing protein [Mycobacteriaceae bacterium]